MLGCCWFMTVGSRFLRRNRKRCVCLTRLYPADCVTTSLLPTSTRYADFLKILRRAKSASRFADATVGLKEPAAIASTSKRTSFHHSEKVRETIRPIRRSSFVLPSFLLRVDLEEHGFGNVIMFVLQIWANASARE